MDRRRFLITGSLTSAGLVLSANPRLTGQNVPASAPSDAPVVLSTWDFGLEANAEAWKCFSSGGSALDAVEQGIRHIESDENNLSVGIGGLPDRDGIVTLDACIMDAAGKAGSVTFLTDIAHPISVARLVMERTPHVMLSGDGALQFALENGFKKQNLLTDKARKAWEAWKAESRYQPVINIENHDTVGLLAMDHEGNLAGGCSTSGLAYKMHGRVGDSPIIGAGLYLDNDTGAAVATGLGELVMRALSSFLVVELMRKGAAPREACEEAIMRIVKKNPDYKDTQVAVIALDKTGRTGAYAIQPGFSYALRNQKINELYKSESYI